MNHRNGVWPALLAVAVAAGCDRSTTTTLEVWAVAHDGGARVEILKDRAHHDSALVLPGDRIEFVCRDCPAGAEFAVEDLHFLGDLDHLADALLRTGITDPARLDALIAELEQPAPAPPGADAAAGGEGYSELERNGAAETAAVLRELRSAFAAPAEGGEHGARLFEEWAPGGFVPVGEAIVSDPVARLTHAGLWKFTWRVRLPGGAEDIWDPHIYGHPERSR